MMDIKNIQNNLTIIKSEDGDESCCPIKLENDGFFKTELELNHELIIKEEEFEGNNLKIQPKNEIDHCSMTSDIIYNCKQCSFTTYSKDSLQSHGLSHSIELNHTVKSEYTKSTVNSVCDYPPLSKCKFEEPLLQHMPQKSQTQFKCFHCSFETVRENDFIKHLIQHKREHTYDCTLCDYKTHTKSYLRQHIRIHSPDTKGYKCSQCEFKTVYKRSLTNHLLKHKKDNSFQCNLCDYKTYIELYLKRHMYIRHSPNAKEYKCLQCQFITMYKNSFRQHLSQHRNDTYKCVFCDYKTHMNRTLKVHMLRHSSNVKEYKCSQCEYKTVYQNIFRMHLLKHNSDNTYQCDFCGYKTHIKVHLKRHIVRHLSNAKEYICSECKFKTVYKKVLIRHLVQHKKEYNYQCNLCDYKTYIELYLKRHMRMRHSSNASLLKQ